MLGTIINTGAIIAGGLFGALFGRLIRESTYDENGELAMGTRKYCTNFAPCLRLSAKATLPQSSPPDLSKATT